jgi:hypothetical protein
VVYAIAKDTGWSEKHILWELPLSRALQYYHCALQAANLWTLEPVTAAKLEEMVPDSLLSYIDELVDSSPE